MFEKSLYDLIRGLRNHKGNEKEYIQNSLKECRIEIRGKDMDAKATALLKLVYLEMFGHDMSWAAFHVLEVMSSAKYLQKRVGYLGAVQSFRPETEVLMLATNLLKKDLVSTSLITMSLPIVTLPHIITSSLAMSVLSDLLPRLTHSSPAIRKKTVVTLYRLALCHPETLRSAWPKIKDRLMDENEDSSVTAAIINVVCELCWRRPQDFLPLAPRFFELLVDSGNNWMAIKLIKLFATLTPLEPRLVRKLLPSLTSIIRTTPAMSLLYECINGIVQGGILSSGDDSVGGEEIATLCVSKLRGMIMVEGDPNLKYVALLAFNKIVMTHPSLVAQQQDVIMDCLDSADISIRIRALDLVLGMVSSDNLMPIVGRLMRQLWSTGTTTSAAEPWNGLTNKIGFNPTGEIDDDNKPEINTRPDGRKVDQSPVIPDEYIIDVISRILNMCSANNYSNVTDFDWYIDVLLELVRNSPVFKNTSLAHFEIPGSRDIRIFDIAEEIGDELRNIAVKVKAVRANASRAAESIIMAIYRGNNSRPGAGMGALRPVVWIAGEYASYLSSPEDVLTALVQITKNASSSEYIAIYLQAVIKIFALEAGNEHAAWTGERKTVMSLLMARIIHTLEPLALHPDLEVQERAVEFSELLRLAAEASAGQEVSSVTGLQETPLLLTQAIPSLFSGMELNSVASGAQRNVPLPIAIELDQPINSRLKELLMAAEYPVFEEEDHDDFEEYYHQQVPVAKVVEPAINRLAVNNDKVTPSYQEDHLDPDIMAHRRAQRREKNRDDPFYIAGNDSASEMASPTESIIQNVNDKYFDVDSIPIMQLDLGRTGAMLPETTRPRKPTTSKPRQLVEVAADETLVPSGTSTPRHDDSDPNAEAPLRSRTTKSKSSLLLVDSSNIGAMSLENESHNSGLDPERQRQEDAEMAKALLEVEKLRLEMQRANERIHAAQGVPLEGTLVKKKVKKSKISVGEGRHDAAKVIKTVKDLKKARTVAEGADVMEGPSLVKRKKKSKKVRIDDGRDEDGDEGKDTTRAA